MKLSFDISVRRASFSSITFLAIGLLWVLWGAFPAGADHASLGLDSPIAVNGSASSALHLAPASIGVGGSAFLDQIIAVDSDTSFSTQFQFRMHGGSGADGLAFMLHNDPDGTSALSAEA